MLRSLLLLFAALTLAPLASAQSQTLVERTFPVRDGQNLAVDVGSGAVTVETTARGEAEVVVRGTGRNVAADFEALRFTATMDGNTLRVRTQPRSRFGIRTRSSTSSFSYTVRVPRRFNVNVDTGSGSVRVGDVEGTLSVDTGSGSVQTGDVRGNASVDTGSGSVRMGRIVGRLSVDTGSGSVQVEEQDGPASIDTGSGSATITLARVAPLTVDTGSGSATVTLPRGAAADLSAEGSSVTLDDAFAFSGRRERGELVGRIGGGGDRIDIETGSGAVRIATR